jgi:2-oxoglutarate ferredoxin oxidoreductase subunit beta
VKLELGTPSKNTWCPGCGDFGILQAVKSAFQGLVDSGDVKPEEIVISSGIGCHAKIVDYVKVNSFYSIHGRVPATISGAKIANPRLKVIGFAGDGDAYDEGISHMVHSARRNIDITMIVHDNQVFALTTGQVTPTSPLGFKGKSTPKGCIEPPINPLHLMLASGATFVARGFSGDIKHLAGLIEEAVRHPGFSVVDVLQPCVSFNDTTQFFKERVYNLNEEGHDVENFKAAWEKAQEKDDRIPIGIFYRVKRDTFESRLLGERVPAEEKGAPSVASVVEEHL